MLAKQPFYDMDKVFTDPLKHVELHHSGADPKSWITAATKKAGQYRQYHHRPDELAATLAEKTGENVYFSQNTFYRTSRAVANIRQLRALYVDIDCHNIGLDPAWVVGKLDAEIFGQKIPDPNIIIFSGRGVIPVWFIEPVPSNGLPLWQAVQKYFYGHLKELGADPKALDAARIFRVAGSVNSKNGATVQVQHRHDFRHTLREIQTEYLPELDKRKQKKRGRPKKVVSLYNLHKLHWTRLGDLTKLVELRAGDMTEHRETACFLYRYWTCCYMNDPRQALAETLAFNGEFTRPLPEREAETATRSAEKAFKNNGYKFTNEKLINWLGITDGEQRELKTIIDRDEKQRRDTERKRKQRRKSGVKTRGEYLQAQNEKTCGQLARLKEALADNPKAKRGELAELLGVNRSHLYRLLNKL